MTLSQLREKLRFKLGEPQEGIWLDTELNDRLNEAAEELANDTYCIERILETRVEEDISSYILPADFLTSRAVYQIDSNTNIPLDRVGIDQLFNYNKQTSTSDSFSHYAIWGQQGNPIATGQPSLGGTWDESNWNQAVWDKTSIASLMDNTIDFTHYLQAKESDADRTIYRIILQKENDDGTIGLSEGVITDIEPHTLYFSAGLIGGIQGYDENTTYRIETYSENRESLFIAPTPSYSDRIKYGEGFRSIRMLYHSLPVKMEYDPDICEIPQRWQDALIDKAKAECLEKINDKNAQLWEQKYLRRVNQIQIQREESSLPTNLNIRANRQRRMAKSKTTISEGVGYTGTLQ